MELSMWVAANMQIMHKFFHKGKLSGTSEISNNLSYTTKIAELLKSHTLASVLLYNNEYHRLQHQYAFWWGSDSQHLYTRFLVKWRTLISITNVPRPSSNPRETASHNCQLQPVTPVCHQFNYMIACHWPNCRFQHVFFVTKSTVVHNLNSNHMTYFNTITPYSSYHRLMERVLDWGLRPRLYPDWNHGGI